MIFYHIKHYTFIFLVLFTNIDMGPPTMFDMILANLEALYANQMMSAMMNRSRMINETVSNLSLEFDGQWFTDENSLNLTAMAIEILNEFLENGVSESIGVRVSYWLLAPVVLLLLVAVLGNSCVLYFIAYKKTNKYGSDVAMSGMAILEGLLPFAILVTIDVERLLNRWPYGNVGCKLLSAIPDFVIYTSAWIKAYIAFTRMR